MTECIGVLQERFGQKRVLLNEPMKKHTTFRVGGNAAAVVLPQSAEEVAFAINTCKIYGISSCIIGNGSNILVKDGGFNGVIVKLSRRFGQMELVGENVVKARAGVSLAALAGFALDNGLSGLEFASGIPGSLGGAIYMNAGAYDGEMKDCVYSCDVLMDNGELATLSGADMDFSYRYSRAQNEGFVILGASLSLQSAVKADIKAKMDDLNNCRREKQPLEMPNAGSTFKRPAGYFAGKLIMDSGLSGYTIGGAQVSPKHCGFIVNTGVATACDIISLMEYVIKTVRDKYGVELEPEVRVIGI